MRVTSEYGKYLPYSMSVCDYNFSSGIIYFPEIQKSKILEHGGYWNENDDSTNNGALPDILPDNVKDTPTSLCAQALLCEETGYRYNISPNELEFYKQKNIALPRTHFDVRTLKRIRKAAVLSTSPYNCCYCNKEIDAYYPKSWGYERIACVDCYQQNLN